MWGIRYPWRIHGANLPPIPFPLHCRVHDPSSPQGELAPCPWFLAGIRLRRESCHLDFVLTKFMKPRVTPNIREQDKNVGIGTHDPITLGLVILLPPFTITSHFFCLVKGILYKV
jgi:hypothetical protein